MTNLYHICYSSHNEVMFRSDEDMDRFFNILAVEALKTGSQILADAEMSDHVHICLFSTCVEELIHKTRYAYTMYFNRKYHRNGRLGEKNYFRTELNGRHHILAGISYVMRQGLHHGLTALPFEYRHCSANCIFAEDRGVHAFRAQLPNKSRYKYLPGEKSIPDNIRMSDSGLIFREDIIKVRYVEELFGSVKNFMFYMTRNSDEKWNSEQREENAQTEVISLGLIEGNDSTNDLRKMIANEKGKVDYTMASDIELCNYIDSTILPYYAKLIGLNPQEVKLYDFSLEVREKIANDLIATGRNGGYSYNGKCFCKKLGKYFKEQQLKRTLAI